MSWMSSLKNQQDGCLRMVAQQASLEDCDTNNWHKRLQCAHQGHYPRTEIKFNIYVLNWLTEKLNWNTSDQNEIHILSKKKTTCTYASIHQRSERLEIQSGQRNGTSTSENIRKNNTENHGQKISNPMERNKNKNSGHVGVQQRSSTAARNKPAQE